jgi:hypothetical protein
MSQASTIPVFTNRADCPIVLASRFGEWMCDSTLIGNWNVKPGSSTLKMLAELAARFPTESDHICIPGDPRNHQCEEEIGFVAEYKGRIGIHAELELTICEGPANDPHAYEDDPEMCPPERFSRLVRFWQEKLSSMAPLFRHTYFFIAYGDMTYNERVTLNAFTPLDNGTVNGVRIARDDDFLMLSPYLYDHEKPSILECETIRRITQALAELGYNDEMMTGAEAAQKTNHPFALSLNENTLEQARRDLLLAKAS